MRNFGHEDPIRPEHKELSSGPSHQIKKPMEAIKTEKKLVEAPKLIEAIKVDKKIVEAPKPIEATKAKPT